MSLALLALRLQAVAALNSHPTIAALCEGRVYDSRIGDFDHHEPVPVIVVTTEDVEGEPWSENNGGAPFDDECNLVLEVAMNQIAPVLDDEGNETGDEGIACPATDQTLEATLNLIVWCAEQILTTFRPHPLANSTPAGTLMRAVTRKVSRRSIQRFSTDDSAERLAIHLVTYRVSLKGELADAANPPTGEFAGLPDPLRSVCVAAEAGTDAQRVCRLVAAQLQLPELRRLSGATFRQFPPTAGFDPASADFEIGE